MLLLISLSVASAMSQETGNQIFDKGVKQYTSGNYKEAVELWTILYNAGYRSSGLNYNIANAYFKLQNIPKAILFYERAYLLDPANEDVNYNLQIARTLIVDRFQEIPELFFIRWYNILALLLSSNNWALISVITFVICLGALSLYIYSAKYMYKVAGFWLALIMLFLAVSAQAFSQRNKYLVYESHNAIIFSPVISGKSSPDASGTDLFVLHEGTRVSIEDEVGEWYEIRLSDGNKGWVPANSLDII